MPPKTDIMETDDSLTEDRKLFAALMLEHQEKIKAYISCLVSDRNVVGDILQEVNLVLLEKEDEYDGTKRFFPWACGIAKWKILSYFRDRKRVRMTFDSCLLNELEDKTVRFIENQYDVRWEKLEKCLGRLKPEQDELLRKHYGEGYTIEELAVVNQKSYQTMRKIIYRIKRTLLQWVEQSK
jgi:RNA polymerase sigma-70 factor (ECF subfamily)